MPCPHCDCLLSKKTFEAHKRLYYDGSTDQWIKKCCLEASEDLDFEEPIDFHSSSDTEFPDIVADAPQLLILVMLQIQMSNQICQKVSQLLPCN